MDERAFQSKARAVMSGNTVLATSPKGPPNNSIYMSKVPGEDCAKRTMLNGGLGVGVGIFYGAFDIAWYPDPITDFRGKNVDKTPMRVILGRVLQPAVFMGIITAAYTLTECTVEDNRQKKDPFNAVCGGMVAGFLIGGLAKRRFDLATACAITTGIAMGCADMFGPGMNWNRSHGIKDKGPAVRPKTHVESPELTALKELYPKFKDL